MSSHFRKYRLVPSEQNTADPPQVEVAGAAMQAEQRQAMQEKRIATYDPKLRSMAFLQTEINEILNNRTLSPDARLQIFTVAQNRFLALKKVGSKAAPGGAEEDEEVVPVARARKHYEIGVDPGGNRLEGNAMGEDEDEFADAFSEISEIQVASQRRLRKLVDELPKTYRKKAQDFLSLVHSQDSGIEVDDHLRVYLHGRMLPKANFGDIIEYIFRPRKNNPQPPDFKRYWDYATGAFHLPASMIPNRALHEKHLEHIGHGRSRSKKAGLKSKKSAKPHILRLYKK